MLIENKDRGEGIIGALNHLGVEVDDPDQVAAAADRLAGQSLDTLVQENTTCCYALQDKVWVNDPDEVPWEFYTVLADAPEAENADAPEAENADAPEAENADAPEAENMAAPGAGCCPSGLERHVVASGATVSACC